MEYWPEKSNFMALLEFRTLQHKKIDLEYKLMCIEYEEVKSMREIIYLP